MWFLLFFLIFIPAVEIWLFVEVGERIGGWSTVGLTFLTAAMGILLVQYQGLNTLLEAQRKMAEDCAPAKEMFDGVCIALGGLLLLIPGFFTDFWGFLFLIPWVRVFLLELIIDGFLGYFSYGMVSMDMLNKDQKPDDDDVIDAEYEVVDEEGNPTDKDDNSDLPPKK
tara:strand:- start:276 stop:779 length:504 start_codon:yes stop_codon:yes gene_type:complete